MFRGWGLGLRDVTQIMEPIHKKLAYEMETGIIQGFLEIEEVRVLSWFQVSVSIGFPRNIGEPTCLLSSLRELKQKPWFIWFC